jgi:hypothetical protein
VFKLEYVIVILILIVLSLIYYFFTQNTYQVTKKELRKLPESYEIIEKVILESDKESFMIDNIVIGKSGVYLLNIIDRKGIIIGDESQEKWKETKGEQVEEFNNPIFKNLIIRRLVREKIEDKSAKIPMHSLVLFHKKANLNDLFSESLTIRANSVLNYIKDDKEVLTEEQIKNISQKLKA